MSDDELERLKARRLAEMRRNASARREGEERAARPAPPPREALLACLGYRGLEVIENAEAQYPAEAGAIVDRLGELVAAGEIAEELDGGKLLALFRHVGLPVRVRTSIKVEQDGKLVSLSDRLRGGR